jgi:hypothetical protein
MKVICNRDCNQRIKDGTCGLDTITIQKDGCGRYVKMPEFEPFRADNVAVFDNAGIPSIMVRFSPMTDKELFGGPDKVHPMFLVQGKLSEIYISKYKNIIINGRAYSLPLQQPAVNVNFEEALNSCRNKGEGWHLLTGAEHGFLANFCLKNGTLPHGNTNRGEYHADRNEKGIVISDSGRTLTGSGPENWYHNNTVFGVDGLCGDVWEWLAGMRMNDGVLQVVKDNDAAAAIDLSESSIEWTTMIADGYPVCIDTSDGVRFSTNLNESGNKRGWNGCLWKDAKIDFEITEQMQELGLFPGEPNTALYADSEGERLPVCGGYWYNGSYAGVFYLYLSGTRSDSSGGIGFRSAYYRALESENL